MAAPFTKVKKVKPFQELLIHVKDHYGTIGQTCSKIGISDRTYNKLMIDDELTAIVGRKILNHYNEIKKIGDVL